MDRQAPVFVKWASWKLALDLWEVGRALSLILRFRGKEMRDEVCYERMYVVCI